jgi:hypothetical protein
MLLAKLTSCEDPSTVMRLAGARSPWGGGVSSVCREDITRPVGGLIATAGTAGTGDAGLEDMLCARVFLGLLPPCPIAHTPRKKRLRFAFRRRERQDTHTTRPGLNTTPLCRYGQPLPPDRAIPHRRVPRGQHHSQPRTVAPQSQELPRVRRKPRSYGFTSRCCTSRATVCQHTSITPCVLRTCPEAQALLWP